MLGNLNMPDHLLDVVIPGAPTVVTPDPIHWSIRWCSEEEAAYVVTGEDDKTIRVQLPLRLP